MNENFFKQEYIPPDERDLHKFKGSNLKEVIEFLEDKNVDDIQDYNGEKEWQEYLNRKNQSIFDGFLNLLHEKGIRVSTPEWLQFLQVINKNATAKNLKEMVSNDELLNKIRLFAQTTLVKDKSDEAAFYEAFDEYFESAAKMYKQKLENQQTKEELQKNQTIEKKQPNIKEKIEIKKVGENLKLSNNEQDKKNTKENTVSEPDFKEQLGIEKVDENLKLPEDIEHSDDENIHGGDVDQHNDILRQADKSKIGGGKGSVDKNIIVNQPPITHEGVKLTKQDIRDREKKIKKVDRRLKYEVRPDKASMREVTKNLRRIITDVSEVKSSNMDLKGTVKNFARRDFRFDYEREKTKQSEVILFIDVGGPVDEWSPLMKEVTEGMAKGLTKLEVYLFHNNLYGYVWKPDSKNLLASSYAEPNSLIDLKKIIKKRKKVIVYGDAEMSYSEFEEDCCPPSDNNERIKKFGMDGDDCLKFIKKKSDSVVWINPVFAKEWEDRDDSGTIEAISDIIPMHDLTVGGVEDAIKKLMKK